MIAREAPLPPERPRSPGASLPPRAARGDTCASRRVSGSSRCLRIGEPVRVGPRRCTRSTSATCSPTTRSPPGAARMAWSVRCGRSRRTRTDSCGSAPTAVSFGSMASASSHGRVSAATAAAPADTLALLRARRHALGRLRVERRPRPDRQPRVTLRRPGRGRSTGAVTAFSRTEAEPSGLNGRRAVSAGRQPLGPVGRRRRPARRGPSTPSSIERRDSGSAPATVSTSARSPRGPLRTGRTVGRSAAPLSLSQDAGRAHLGRPIRCRFRALGDGPRCAGSEAGRGYRLLHDRDGNLWVATIGQGLWRVTHSTSRGPPTVERTTVLSGLSSDAVRTVFEDRDGNIWAGTTEACDRLVPHRVTPLVGSRASSTPSLPRSTAASGRDRRRPIPLFTRCQPAGSPSRSRLPVRGITAIRAASTGGLWVSTPTALYRVQGSPLVPSGAAAAEAGRSTRSPPTPTAKRGSSRVVVRSCATDGGAAELRGPGARARDVRTNAALVDRNGQSVGAPMPEPASAFTARRVPHVR